MNEFEAAIRLVLKQRNRRPWFWKPQWHWFGWRTLSPIQIGHDQYARRTIVLGWTVTGRVIIPLWDCGDATCHREAAWDIMREGDDE